MLGQSVGTNVNYGQDISSELMVEKTPERNYVPFIVVN
jgi:hypothetical protein